MATNVSRLRAALKPLHQNLIYQWRRDTDTQIDVFSALYPSRRSPGQFQASTVLTVLIQIVSVSTVFPHFLTKVCYILWKIFKNTRNAFHDLVSTVNTWNCLKLTKVSLNSMLCLPQLHNSFLQSPWITAKPPQEIRLDVKFGSLEARNASLARRLAKHDPVHTSTILACHSHLCHGFLCSP